MASAVAGRDHHQVGLVGEADVSDVRLVVEIEQVAGHPAPRQSLQCEGGDEFARGPRHHHAHVGLCFAQQSTQLRSFVGRDAPGDSEDDAFSDEPRHRYDSSKTPSGRGGKGSLYRG